MRSGVRATGLLLLLALCLPGAAPVNAASRPDLIVAFTAKVLTDVNAKDAMAALKIYAAELAGRIGRMADSYVYESQDEIVRDVRAQKVDLIAMPTLDYLRMRDRVDVELALAHVRGGKKTQRYLLLTHRKNGYSQLGDLKHRKIVIPQDDEVAALFLDTFLRQNRLGGTEGFFSLVQGKSKTSQVVLPVFFGQADACLVGDVYYRTMTEMNPQLGRDLKVMAESPEFIATLSVFRRGLDDEIKRQSLEVARTLRDTPRGQQVLMLFKMEALAPIQEADLESLKALFREHERLRAGR
jgi:phosphonate transport system substrate-binding protein